MSIAPTTEHDGVIVDDVVEAIPGLLVTSYRLRPDLALRTPQDGYVKQGRPISLIVVHNTVGDWPLRVLPGLGADGDLAERNASYWRNSPRQSGTQLIVDQDGTVLCLADLARVAAYGAGHHRANAEGIQIEMAATSDRTTHGSVLYQGQIDACALLCDWLATRFGLPKQAAAPRPRGRELVRALADGVKPIKGLADHCCFTRNRGLGDTGFLVQAVLAARYGWQLVDWDAS
jgi:hypothetical protein